MTTEAKVEEYLGIDINSSHSAAVANFIVQVTAWIERYVGKKFVVDSTSDRYFDGNGRSCLLVDSFISGTITSLQILDSQGNVTNTLTEGISNDFLAYPLNSSEKNEIRLVRNVTTFPAGPSRVKITAKWGVSITAPAEIELVATKLVAKILTKALDGGELDSKSLGDSEVTYKEIDETAEALGIYQILDMHREIPI